MEKTIKSRRIFLVAMIVILVVVSCLVVTLTINKNPQSTPTNGILAGWRSSIYGHQQDLSPGYWINTATKISSKISNSVHSGVWIIGYSEDENCYLTFPSPKGTYPNIIFNGTDLNEEYLKAFDDDGLQIWLQVEPANADIEILIDLVLGRYKHHPSVIGFGIDIEWRETISYPEGRRVTNEEAITWINRVKSHNPNYKLFLKHWLTDRMPTNHPEDLVFVDDSQGFNGLSSLASEFKEWGSYFHPSNVSFQVGYVIDKPWWSHLADPARDIGNALVNNIKNCVGIFWVDFSILEVFPRGIVIFNMDDMQAGWLEDVAIALTELHISKDIDMVNGVVPYNMGNPLISVLQDWYTNHSNVIEIAEHGYAHSETDYELRYIQKGLELFQSWGMRPYCWIPPFSNVDWDTSLYLQNLGFHTMVDGLPVTGVRKDTAVKIIDDAAWLSTRITTGPSSELKTSSQLMNDIDAKIDQKGFALVTYHMQDFSNTNSRLDVRKYNQFSEILDTLKNSGKYVFMTAEEYYRHLDSNKKSQ